MSWREFPIGKAVEGTYEILPRDIPDMDRRYLPLPSCFGYGELEYVAAEYIVQCQRENLWRLVTPEEYDRMCGELLKYYNVFDEPEEQPFYPPSRVGAGKFFLLDGDPGYGLFVLGDDGNYRPTERFIRACYECKQKRG